MYPLVTPVESFHDVKLETCSEHFGGVVVSLPCPSFELDLFAVSVKLIVLMCSWCGCLERSVCVLDWPLAVQGLEEWFEFVGVEYFLITNK